MGLDHEQVLRYGRQLILKDIGPEGQEKLQKGRVLVVGAGGLGSPVLCYLAAAGVGTLGIVDFDTVGVSNLQRQILFGEKDVGQKKVQAAAQRLQELNSAILIRQYPTRADAGNLEEILRDYDVIVDATDNLAARYLVTDGCYLYGKPLVEGAVVGFTGILMTILPGKSPCYRCLYPAPPPDGIVPSCSEIGILGAVAGTIGSLQAVEAVKLLTGKGETLSGRILVFDGLELRFREIRLDRSPDCPLCGEHPAITELDEYEIICRNKRVEDFI